MQGGVFAAEDHKKTNFIKGILYLIVDKWRLGNVLQLI